MSQIWLPYLSAFVLPPASPRALLFTRSPAVSGLHRNAAKRDTPQRRGVLLPPLFSAALLAMFATIPARAWVTPPALDPADPKEGDIVYVTFSSGFCDGFGSPIVVRSGMHVHFEIDGAHSDDYEFCYFETLDRRYSLGSFAPGNYIVQVDRTYTGWDGIERHPMATLYMVVSPLGETKSIPTLAPPFLVILMLWLTTIASKCLKNHLQR
jgi:hypothetical protein